MAGNGQSKPEPKYPSEKEASRFLHQVVKRARHQQDINISMDTSETTSNVDDSCSSTSSDYDKSPSPKRKHWLSSCPQAVVSTCSNISTQADSEPPQHSTMVQVNDKGQFSAGRLYERDVSRLSEALARHAHKWKEIGQALGFSPNELDIITAKPLLLSGAPNSWLTDMLNIWVQWTPETQHGKYATLHDLLKALQSKAVGLGAVAEEIKEFIDNHCKEERTSDNPSEKEGRIAISPKPESVTPCEQYAFYLRSYYTRNNEPADKWPGIGAKKFTNLAVISNVYECREDYEDMRKATIHGSIDNILRDKTSIYFADILQPNVIDEEHHAIKQVLMEGAPGIGKSTLSWEICQKWGSGELFQEYSLVVMLRFRDPWVRKVKSLSELFRFPGEPELQDKLTKQIKQTQGKGLLLILEGFDEAPASLREPNSLFSELFRGELLPNAAVMMTSRPSATQNLREWCKGKSSRRIEVLGFGQEEIIQYIKSHFNDTKSQEDFVQYLELYPHISSLMYVPLNAAIVTHVYKACKTASMLVPQTMTELYTALVKTLLLRYMKEIPEYQGIQIKRFTDLPSSVYEKFLELCKLAYDGIVQVETKIIFSDLPENFDSLGLLQSIPELYIDKGTSFSYNFLHLTVQEFLAAYYLSSLGGDQIESFLEKNLNKNAVVCRFLAGHSQKAVAPISNVLFKQTSRHDCSRHLFVDIPALLMLFELHNPPTIARMFQSKTALFLDHDEMNLNNDRTTSVYPFDYYALGYCICTSSCSWNLTLSHANIMNLDMLAMALNVYNSNPTGKFTREEDPAVAHSLTIIGTNGMAGSRTKPVNFGILTDCMNAFPNLRKLCLGKRFYALHGSVGSLLKSLPVSVTCLDVECSGLAEEECIILNDILVSPSHCIEHLVVQTKFQTRYVSTFNIFDCIAESISSLVTLHLDGVKIGDYGVDLLVKSLRNNSTMESLSLKRSLICDEGAIALAGVLEFNSALKSINLANNSIGDNGTTALGKVLKCNSSLESLNLKQNYIGDDGATALACILESKDSTLMSLNLRVNSIGHSGAIALANALRINSAIKSLDLGGNSLGNNGATAIANALISNSTMESLNLASNSIGDEGVIAFVCTLEHKDSTLKCLDLRGNSIGNIGATAIANALRNNSTMESLNLGNNSIGYDGANAFASALKHKDSTLKSLDLAVNSIGSSGAIALADALRNNSTLESLDIMRNYIDDDGAAAFVDTLKYNSTLKSLHLQSNSISIRGIQKLADAPKHNNHSKLKFLHLDENYRNVLTY